MSKHDALVKMIAFDLDGTLLNPEKALTPYTLETLKQCAAAGIKTAVATGRAFQTMPPCILNCRYLDYAVTSNGACIYRMPDGNLLKRRVLPANSATKLIAYALANHLGLELFIDGKAYAEPYYYDHPEAFGFDRRSLDYLYSTRTKMENPKAFFATHQNHLESIAIILRNAPEKEEIQRRFSADDGLYITSSHPKIMEFSAAGGGKANAIQFILQAEHLSRQTLACFGNAENDVEMIELARIGILTADAPPHIRHKADAVCGSCAEDGVAKYLQTHLLHNLTNESM